MTQLKRNRLCRCGSGKKYKKCCMGADEQEQNAPQASETNQGPTPEQAIEFLRNYTNERVLRHNAAIQLMRGLEACLLALPQDWRKDVLLKDIAKHKRELTGEHLGPEARITRTYYEYTQQFPVPQKPENQTAGQDANADIKEESTEPQESTNEQGRSGTHQDTNTPD